MKGRFLLVVFALHLFSRSVFGGTLVQMQFYLGISSYIGEVDVELYDQDKPATTTNFKRLIQSGAYSDGFFHRCVPGFVLQGGGFFAFNPFSTNLIGPPYSNLASPPNFGNVSNEFNVGKFYSNTNWTIAMAKGTAPDSANSQFFFNLADNSSSLDNPSNSGGFTVFGHVVRGTNILGFFNTLYYGYGLQDLTQTYGTNGANTLFTQLPSREIGSAPPPYDELIYYTITALTAQVAIQTNGARQISWTSVSGLTNNVEFSPTMPPTWHVLFSVTNGSGSQTTYTDTNTNNAGFYRIHVLF